MSDIPAKCKGCRVIFESTGRLIRHLNQSRNELCQLHRQESLRDHALPLPASLSSSSVVTVSDISVSTQDEYGRDFSSQNLEPYHQNHQTSENDAEVEDALEKEVEKEVEEVLEEGEWEMVDDAHAAFGEAMAPFFEHEAEPPHNCSNHTNKPATGDNDNEGIPARVRRYTEDHPGSRAGSVVLEVVDPDAGYAHHVGSRSNPWAPFASKLDWDFACWVKLQGPGSNSTNDLLDIDQFREMLGLSFKNMGELNEIIDKKLPKQPQFHRREVVVDGESIIFHSRDVVECIKTLWRNPEYADDLIVEPERQFADEEEQERIYHDMHTGDWWWRMQTKVEKETEEQQATILPLIISSDKTQLTQFRQKTAYPVYITLGNIPKHIRRKPSRQAQILLAYLPTTKLEHISNQAARRRAMGNLFHGCMRFILRLLETLGRTGITLVSGDGLSRRCFPILAAYVGDYPEQLLVALIKFLDCPVCAVKRKGLGDQGSALKPRKLAPILTALATIDKGPKTFKKACLRAGIKPVQDPFWHHLPFSHIYGLITPDILHQMYQGVIKHLLSWLTEALGTAELDRRAACFPPNHHICVFLKGISGLSRVSGTEHDQICCFLLGLVVDVKLPAHIDNPSRLTEAVRGELDFLYLAKYPVHSSKTLEAMRQALRSFQDNRAIFVDLGIRDDFDIPKVHFLEHYFMFICRFGSLDNFNTEYTERLHIDMAKDAFVATNMKDKFVQMTVWLDRCERILAHEKYLKRYQERLNESFVPRPRHIPALILHRRLHMAKHPTHKAVRLDAFVKDYGAKKLVPALQTFVIRHLHPRMNSAQVTSYLCTVYLLFVHLPVYHCIKFTSHDPYALDPNRSAVVDSIHVDPASQDKYGKAIPARFDTVIVNCDHGEIAGMRGYCVAQV
ncbi:hypothetical protein NP233_g11966 [Leucocoprinus birnbaumii]|uniref:Uncharacterized protein n=1 Tax=Leucocoprinus birnbaumii TaxID=56174 RepID=A0AAD5YQE9_9AGAR|nr:hypothetical protein NP233_g11966 [Leucocoprinus birnbaumii]